MAHRNLSTADKLTTEQHWDNYSKFCYYDMLSGGPDAHLTLAGYLSKDLPIKERLWHAGVYVGVYNVPTAEIIWGMFSHDDMMRIDIGELTDWLTKNWKGIATRTERKCVRIPANMAFYFKNYAEWVEKYPKWTSLIPDTPEERYDALWVESQKSVKFLGRYSGFKLLEYYTKWCDIPINLPDIRPIGGWSPRSMLSILYPDYKDILLGDDSPGNIATVKDISNDFLDYLRDDKALKRMGIDMYKMEVFLCDYKQCYFGRRQYPGRSQDSEIQYHTKLTEYWDYDFGMIRGRSEIFPSWALGERNGWTHVRKELGKVLYDYDYMWTDSLYDYKNTLDLSVPTKKACTI